ncbi:uncharacterized protein [Pseudochaenichthys georgianus]|uniref:uncharacterized protein n=1 Tax=Pseudochaenichthys georgianus TaxID=52239 RepID=UPI00146F89B9|nr:uncharacterized protein LOC117447441 [Pseudochaenichthys georgianus]
MDGVLEGATVLCVCKLSCSLLFLPSLTSSYSPASFCCCCLLLFTDFLVTVFLSFLWIFESWVSELTLLGDVIALRFLIFLSETYGAVLLLITPLIAVESVTRLPWPHSVVTIRKACPKVDSIEKLCFVIEVNVEEEEVNKDSEDTEKRWSHVVSYLCCLSVWVAVAFNVSLRWKQQEVRAVACLHSTNSLVRCLPNMFSHMPSSVNPRWGMAFLFFLLIVLTKSLGLIRRNLASAQTHREKSGVNNNGDSCCKDPVLTLSAPSRPVNPGIVGLEPEQCVDPEKTESSCTVHRAYSWNSVQMSAYHHGDFVLISPECLSVERGQKHERTKRGTPCAFPLEEHVDSQYRSQSGWRQRGFPCPGVNVMIGFLAVLSICVLPLYLSMNILVIRTIEILLGLCITSLVSSAANTSNSSYMKQLYKTDG